MKQNQAGTMQNSTPSKSYLSTIKKSTICKQIQRSKDSKVGQCDWRPPGESTCPNACRICCAIPWLRAAVFGPRGVSWRCSSWVTDLTLAVFFNSCVTTPSVSFSGVSFSGRLTTSISIGVPRTTTARRLLRRELKTLKPQPKPKAVEIQSR